MKVVVQNTLCQNGCMNYEYKSTTNRVLCIVLPWTPFVPPHVSKWSEQRHELLLRRENTPRVPGRRRGEPWETFWRCERAKGTQHICARCRDRHLHRHAQTAWNKRLHATSTRDNLWRASDRTITGPAPRSRWDSDAEVFLLAIIHRKTNHFNDKYWFYKHLIRSHLTSASFISKHRFDRNISVGNKGNNF